MRQQRGARAAAAKTARQRPRPRPSAHNEVRARPPQERHDEGRAPHNDDERARPLQEQRDDVRAPTATAEMNGGIVAAPGGAEHRPSNIATEAEPGTETRARATTHSDERARPPHERHDDLRAPPHAS